MGLNKLGSPGSAMNGGYASQIAARPTNTMTQWGGQPITTQAPPSGIPQGPQPAGGIPWGDTSMFKPSPSNTISTGSSPGSAYTFSRSRGRFGGMPGPGSLLPSQAQQRGEDAIHRAFGHLFPGGGAPGGGGPGVPGMPGSGGGGAPGSDINTLADSFWGGKIYDINTMPQDIRGTRQNLANYFGDLSGNNAMAPDDPSAIGPTSSMDQLGPGSAFFNHIQEQLNPVFAQRRAQALAQAKESAGNLTGSGFANILGNQVNKSLGEENAQLLDYATRSAQSEQQRQAADANRAQDRNLSIYGTRAGINNQNAGRFSDLLGRFTSTGVAPSEIVNEGGAAAALGPLLGMLGGGGALSGLFSGGGADGQGNFGTAGDILGWAWKHRPGGVSIKGPNGGGYGPGSGPGTFSGEVPNYFGQPSFG